MALNPLRYHVERRHDCIGVVDTKVWTGFLFLLKNTPGVVHWQYGRDEDKEAEAFAERLTMNYKLRPQHTNLNLSTLNVEVLR